MPTLKKAKTLWGVDEATDPANWDALFGRIKAEGFLAIECNNSTFRRDTPLFQQLLEKHGLGLIVQVHTTGGELDEAGVYQYCTSNKLHDHLASFVALVTEAAALKPLFVNSHSGHDSWGMDKALSFFKQAMKIETALGVKVVHETHRQRLLATPYSTAEILAKPEMAKLKINADLSHWCVVCEHVFDPALPRDDFWPATLELVARHCEFVHCRVGFGEGPQVPEPDDTLYASEVAAHCSWWRAIWAAQAAREPEGTIWAEPEHGPPPYLHVAPFTHAPCADLWAVNSRMSARMTLEFDAAMQEAAAAAAAPAAAAGGSDSKGPSWGELTKKDGARYDQGGEIKPPPGVVHGKSFLAEATKAEKKAAAEAAEAKAASERAWEKAVKAVVKEGGKKGVEIEGASDMGGLEFFCTTVENADGDIQLLNMCMTAMNAEPDPNAEDRKGCSGPVGKMIFSAGVEQLAIVAYVPESKTSVIDIRDWVRHVVEAVGGNVMMNRVMPAESPQGGKVLEAAIGGDAQLQKFPIKDKDTAMAAAFAFLRSKGAFPEDTGSDDDEACYGDDAFDEMNGW